MRAPETERKRQLFAWADTVLKDIGLHKAVARAETLEALHKITIDINAVEITLAIQAALHPASGGKCEEHFHGLLARTGRRVVVGGASAGGN
jgi:hypothetical protein